MTNVKKIKLKNGLRIIVVPREESLTATVAVLVSAGSKYETKETNGISHFLEHMCFKGTKKRPRPIDIASELDALGAQYNAFTSREYTSYYAKVQAKFLPKAMDVVADLYLNPTLNEEDIKVEKGVIVEEINMYEDIPRHKVQEIFFELMYGDQPAAWSIAGTKENVRKFKRNDFLKYRANNYLPNSTVVVVSGDIKPLLAASLAESYFSEMAGGVKTQKTKTKESQLKPAEIVFPKNVKQAHLILGARAFDIHNPKRFALDILAEILGGGMSSRLFKKIRDELGLAYYVKADTNFFSDHGFLSVSAGVDIKKIELVLETIVQEMRDMKEHRVGEKELARAKEHFLGSVFMNIETSDEMGYFYGLQEIMGMPLHSPKEIARRVKMVSSDDVMSVARSVFKESRTNLAVVGPFNGKSFSGILRM